MTKNKYKYPTKRELAVLNTPYKELYNINEPDKKITIKELNWPVRLAWRLIEELDVKTVEDLLNLADINLLKVRGLGRQSVRAVHYYLSRMSCQNKCKIINGKLAWQLQITGRFIHTLNFAYEHDAEFVASLLANLGYEIEWNREEQDI